MSLYLQRLLDRAALPASPAVAPANPLLVSGSPILTFDQRLASTEMADDFSILGATPDLPEAAEEAPLSAPPLARPNIPGAAQPASLGTVERITENPSPPPPARPVRRGTPDFALPEFGQAAESNDAAQAVPARTLETPLVEPPRQSAPPSLEADLAPAPPVSVQSNPDLPPFPSRRSADPPAVRAEAEPGPTTRQARLPDPAPRTEGGPAPSPPGAPEARPFPSLAPTFRETVRPLPAPTPAVPASAAEPIAAAVPPLAPPPRGLSVEEVERMIDEAIGAERDRGAARGMETLGTQQAATPGPQGEAPAKRPATAAQASLIGSLESSRFRPMLFGVRRR